MWKNHIQKSSLDFSVKEKTFSEKNPLKSSETFVVIHTPYKNPHFFLSHRLSTTLMFILLNYVFNYMKYLFISQNDSAAARAGGRRGSKKREIFPWTPLLWYNNIHLKSYRRRKNATAYVEVVFIEIKKWLSLWSCL